MDDSGAAALAFIGVAELDCLQIHSTCPLERVSADANRSTNLVGILPNEAAAVRLVVAPVLKQ